MELEEKLQHPAEKHTDRHPHNRLGGREGYQSVAAMMPTFRKMGAAAGAPKCRKELRMPPKKATRLPAGYRGR